MSAAARTMHVHVSTPAERITLAGVTRLRFTTWDGQRGVLPGHEPALALVAEAAIEVTLGGDGGGPPQERFLACEEGLARIDPAGVEIAARWAVQAASLDELRALVDDRARARRAIEAEARALAHRHEVALQEALTRLVRGAHA